MKLFKFLISSLIAWCSMLQTASAQTYPEKPASIITTFSAESGPDAVLRQDAERLGKQFGQSFIVDNKPGGNGFIALETAKRASPDGYTLIQMTDAHMSLLPHLYKMIPSDALRDFDPVNTLFRTNFLVVVPATSPWKALQPPHGTPADILNKLNTAVEKALTDPDLRGRFATFGFEFISTQPQEIKRAIQADLKRYAEFVKTANITVEQT